MDHLDEIVKATRWRRVLVLDYAGNPGGIRVIHPHAVFLTAAGQPVLEGLQISGVTMTPDLPSWRALRIELIEDAHMTADVFDVSPLFNPDASRYRNLIARCSVRSTEPTAEP